MHYFIDRKHNRKYISIASNQRKNIAPMIDFQTHPDRYRHWQISYSDRVAYLTLGVDVDGGLADGYELKLNSYDIGVDISGKNLQLGLNFATRPAELFSGKDMGEDALRLLNK